MLKRLLPIALLAVLPSSGAFASPASASTAAVSTPVIAPIQLVDMRRHDHRGPRHGNKHRRGKPHFTPGGRYRSAPHGWRSYRARPRDWRTRGCIVVGPAWFCP